MNDLTTIAPPAPVSVTLAMTPAISAMITRGMTYLSVARAYEITDAETAQLAADELTVVKRSIVALKAMKADFVRPAKEIIGNAEKHFDPGITGFEDSETLLKTRLLEWDGKERSRVEAERAVRAEEERKTRQKAEQEAAAVRARAEAEAAEKRRQAEAAEAARRKALEDGNSRAAAKAAADVAKLNEQAQAAIENGNARAQDALVAAAAAAPPPVAEQAKLEGFGSRKNWVAELADGVTEAQARAMIAAECVRKEPDGSVVILRPDLLKYLMIDAAALNKLAKSQEDAMCVPGFVARNRPIGAGSKK